MNNKLESLIGFLRSYGFTGIHDPDLDPRWAKKAELLHHNAVNGVWKEDKIDRKSDGLMESFFDFHDMPERRKPISVTRKKAEQERQEKERITKEKAEQERQEKERITKEKAEQERQEKERIAKEKAEADRIEAERIAKEKAAKEKKAKKKIVVEPKEPI
jgi:hypothetical protein